MANEGQLKILKSSVEAWNEWRKESHQVVIDLKEAILTAADLSGANLREADLWKANLWNAKLGGANLIDASLLGANLALSDLRRADLRGVKLSRADLRGAYVNEANVREAELGGTDLRGANLSRADLKGAEMWKTNLTEANLSRADLRGADLTEANFTFADLSGTRLSEASVGRSHFCFTSLRTSKGLETCRHQSPSVIDYHTLAESGPLPEVFLRGSGMSDDYIAYWRGVWSEPIQFYSCFISYSNNDGALAQRIYDDLQADGVRCWFAPKDLKIGDKFRLKIDEAVRIYDKLLLLLSEHSVNSDWVEKEVEAAFERERKQKKVVLFPVRIDNAVMDIPNGWPADIRRTRHIGDFTKWKDHDAYKKAFDRMLKDLKAEKASAV